MIAALFRSKAGVVIMVALVCGVFFTLSKLKHRRASATTSPPTMAANEGHKSGGVEQAALLKRTQEATRNRAETIRQERANERQSSSSYDEVGNAFRRRATPEPIPHREESSADPQRPDAIERILVPMLRIHGRKSGPAESLPSLPLIKNPFESVLPALAKSSESRSPASAIPVSLSSPSQRQKPERFVPFGRLIKAELVITLESTEDEMPLVGLITEPVYNNGCLVIPAGTELHSMARPDRIRDRIISTTTWKLIFPREGSKPNGRQITFEGMALDREDRDGNGFTWGIDDGSYGLRGRTIKNGQSQEEMLLFAAESLRAFSGTLTERKDTIVGTETRQNMRNAATAGGQAVLEQYATRIAKEMERNGVYIQVPAGKQFYVYPRQVIDPDVADIPENIARVE